MPDYSDERDRKKKYEAWKKRQQISVPKPKDEEKEESVWDKIAKNAEEVKKKRHGYR